MIQSNYARFVRLCVHYLGNHELSGPSVCSFMRTARRHDRLNNLLKCSICLNLGKAVITTFIELFTLRKPKLIFNYIKQNVRRYLEFDLV